MKIVKKRKNELYNLHFEFEKTSDGKIAYCKNCEPMKEIKMKNSNTSGLIKHLQNTHFNIYSEIMKDRAIPIRPNAIKSKTKCNKSQDSILDDSFRFLNGLNVPLKEETPSNENESSQSAFSYSDPLLYHEEIQNSETISSPSDKNIERLQNTEDIVKYLLDKQYSQDDSDIQGKSWASQYRQLTAEQQIRVKKKIDDIFYEARLENLKSPKTEQ